MPLEIDCPAAVNYAQFARTWNSLRLYFNVRVLKVASFLRRDRLCIATPISVTLWYASPCCLSLSHWHTPMPSHFFPSQICQEQRPGHLDQALGNFSWPNTPLRILHFSFAKLSCCYYYCCVTAEPSLLQLPKQQGLLHYLHYHHLLQKNKEKKRCIFLSVSVCSILEPMLSIGFRSQKA